MTCSSSFGWGNKKSINAMAAIKRARCVLLCGANHLSSSFLKFEECLNSAMHKGNPLLS